MRRFLRKNSDVITPFLVWFIGLVILTSLMVTIEGKSVEDSVWYSVITSSTVGYGGIIATHPITRVATIIFIFTSIGSLAAFISALSTRSKLLTENKRKGMIQSKRDPDVIVVGFPTEAKVRLIVECLQKLWKGVVITCITNQIEEKPGWMVDHGVEFIHGRASETEVLTRANLQLAEKILVLANDPTDPASDEYTSSVVMLCEDINPMAHTIAEKVRDNDDLFKHADCDKVVDVCRPQELVHELLHVGAIDFIDTIFSPDTVEMQSNVKLTHTYTTHWNNIAKDFIDKGMIALGFSTDGGKTFTYAPAPDTVVPEEPMIKVIGRQEC